MKSRAGLQIMTIKSKPLLVLLKKLLVHKNYLFKNKTNFHHTTRGF